MTTAKEAVEIAIRQGLTTTQAAEKWPHIGVVGILVTSAIADTPLTGSPLVSFARMKNLIAKVKEAAMPVPALSMLTGYSPGYVRVVAQELGVTLPHNAAHTELPKEPTPTCIAGPATQAPTECPSELKDDWDIIRQGLDLLYAKLDGQILDPANNPSQRRALIAQMLRVEALINSVTK